MELFTVNALVFFVIGLVSMWTHAIKKWAMGEIKGKPLSWYWTHPKATVLAFMTMIGGIATAILTGTITDYAVGAHVLAAWGIGYGADTVNHQGDAEE